MSPGTYEVAVVGSGAGGAPAALALAERWGDGVAIVEAGKHFTRADFNQRERDMVPALYAGGGMQGTEDGSVGFLQAECVGGSTVINDGICFAPPPELEARWGGLGVPLDLDALAPHVARVERMMGVVQLTRSQISYANYLVGLGAARLGWRGERLRHNTPGCVQCGFRNVGCAYDAKRSMNLSFVPPALDAGAVLHDETRVRWLERRDGAWTLHTDRGALRAKRVVLAAGVVQTPALLLRSGIAAGEGVQVHLHTVVWGDFAQRVEGFAGIPMGYGVMEFADVYGHTGPGYLIEAANMQPMTFSVQPQFSGPDHDDVLARYPHLAGAVCILRSRARGSISLGPRDRPVISYDLIPEDASRIEHFCQRAVELFLAAGAERALLSNRETRWVDAVPASVRIAPQVAYLFAAHLFGGACRGQVCDEVGRVRGQDDLWVLDASAIPEAPGVNPQVTIASLALEGAGRVVG